MELSKNLFQLLRNRQAKVSGILQQTQAFIAQVKTDDGSPQDSSRSDHIHVKDTFTSRMLATPTSIRISTFLQMPLKPMALDSFLSSMAHITPEI